MFYFEKHVITIQHVINVTFVNTFNCDLVTKIWVNISSGDGVLPDDTKPSPEDIGLSSKVKKKKKKKTYHLRCSVVFT